MVENKPSLHREPFDMRLSSAIIFPLQHLEMCLEQLESGDTFEGRPLDAFRESNRACRTINIAVAAFSGMIATRMLSAKTDGFRGKMLKAGGLLALARAVHQAAGAYDKFQGQMRLDSLQSVSNRDLH